ncbi:polymer-forming cytoskeletal protein [Rhodovulum sulfidophilum]|uniref:bactofilin family protein n=1 Tax=Rhodovulum sulfidophilum TaxID=35806 RepID=UPI0019244660|nr:polymer-forming cytoskeletal protein [Rhodovulum sulfidophilum]MBL3596933.1 polymer-forming cytoskeletal protein [Rhodovulum sulfidophilum]MCE8420554.1 polymer-forming cytoskeletal protein [Rhodovulum sulfidophilum]
MFSKSRINEPGPKAGEAEKAKAFEAPTAPRSGDAPIPSAPRAKPPASMLSSDLVVTGNLKTTGDIQIEGTIDGDISAHLLTVGENATVRGEVVADDVVINGRVIGRVRGLKVRLTSTARVEGDIIHKTIAIESGAHFEGSVQRQDDPLNTGKRAQQAPAAGQAQQPRPQQGSAAAAPTAPGKPAEGAPKA